MLQSSYSNVEHCWLELHSTPIQLSVLILNGCRYDFLSWIICEPKKKKSKKKKQKHKFSQSELLIENVEHPMSPTGRLKRTFCAYRIRLRVKQVEDKKKVVIKIEAK